MSKTKGKKKKNSRNDFEKALVFFQDIEEVRAINYLEKILQTKFIDENHEPIINDKKSFFILFLQLQNPDNSRKLEIQKLFELLKISKITDEEIKKDILLEFLSSPVAKFDVSYFVTMSILIDLDYFEKNEYKHYLKEAFVSRFFATEQNINCDIEDFLDTNNITGSFLEEIGLPNPSSDQKISFIKLFLENSNAKILTEKFIKALNHFDKIDQKYATNIFTSFLLNEENSITIEDFFLILENKHIKDLDSDQKTLFTLSFLKNKNSKPNFDFLVWALETKAENKTEYLINITKNFLSNSNSTFEISDLKKIISIIPQDKILEIINAINVDKIKTAQDVCDVICFQQNLIIGSDVYDSISTINENNLINQYLKKEESTAQDLSYIFSRLSPNMSNNYKEKLIVKFLKKLFRKINEEGQNSNIKLTDEDLYNLIKSAGLCNELDRITNILKVYGLYDMEACRKKPVSTAILDIINFCDYLNPSLLEFKYSSLTQLISLVINIKEDDRIESLKIIKNLIGKTKNPDYELYIKSLISKMEKHNMLSVVDELNLAKDIIYIKYPLFSDILNTLKKNENDDSEKTYRFSFQKYFTTKGIAKIEQLLKANKIKDIGEITILDIFSYYDYLSHEIKNLFKFLKPEIIEEIKVKLDKALVNHLLVSNQEKEMLDDLLKIKVNNNSHTIHEEDKTITEEKLISNRVLCGYFKGKVKQFTYENQKLNFEGMNYENEEFKIGLNDLFAKIMTANLDIKNNSNNTNLKITIENITKFFELTFNINIGEIDNGKNKIFYFFKENRNNLAYALTDKNIGIKKFSDRALGSALNDGCSKNIGSIFTTILYESILENKSDEILYFVILDKIISQILNSGGDVIGNDNNPFEHDSVLDYYISLDALKKEMINLCATMGEASDIISSYIIDDFKCDKNGAYKAIEIFLESYVNLTDEDSLNKHAELDQEAMDNLFIYIFLKNINSLPQNVNKIHNTVNKNNHLTEITNKLKSTIPYEKIDNLWKKMKDEVNQYKDEKKDYDQPEKDPNTNLSNSAAEPLDKKNQLNAL